MKEQMFPYSEQAPVGTPSTTGYCGDHFGTIVPLGMPGLRIGLILLHISSSNPQSGRTSNIDGGHVVG